MRRALVAMAVVSMALVLTACGGPAPADERPSGEQASVSSGLYPGETLRMRALIRASAREHGIPEALLHRVIQRESDYRANARNGPYWGLMQILPQTARTMGFEGRPEDLLDPEINLRFAGRYLRGAWLVSDGDIDAAVMWYARGYYFEARDRCLLVETGLAAREVNRRCR